MSVVSSVLSTRSSGWKINPRLSSFMDSIFAIAFGLGLRFVVDAVSHHDFKLTGTLVGLWEGIILLHFLKKMPKSTDPYVAYGVRLFIDFLYTDSVARLVLVLIWTALGMVLADITPALWDDVGLNRIWRHFRRDIYTISRMIPTVAFFPPARTVRFSPSRVPSTIMEEPSVLETETQSIITTEQTPMTPTTSNTIPATTTATTPVAREILKRRVPGYFPGDSDTDTDLGSVRAGPSAGRTSRRLSVYPQHDYDDSATDLSSNNDLDDANLSSGASSASTERVGPSSIIIDTVGIPDMLEEEEPLVVDTAAAAVKNEEGDQTTPRAVPMYLPPTPSDSAVRWRPNLDPEEPLPVRPFSVVRPLSESLPQIPDFLEDAATEDWDKIQPQDYADKPPTPPAKDDVPARYSIPPVPTMTPPQPTQIVPPEAAPAPAAPAVDDDWENLKANFVAPADLAGAGSDKRRSAPPEYKESADFDDIYGDEYVPEPRLDAPAPDNLYDSAFDAGGEVPRATNLMDDGAIPPLGAPFTFSFGQSAQNPWMPPQSTANDDLADFVRQQQEDEKRQQREREAAAEAQRLEEEELTRREEEARLDAQRKLEEEEAEAIRKLEEEEAELRRKLEEEEAEAERVRKAEEKKRKAEEKAERKRKEEEDELARQTKREEEAAEALRLEEEAKAAEKKRKAEIKEKKKKKKEEEEAKKAAEAEVARLAEEEERKKEEEATQRRKDAEEAAARRQAAQEETEQQEREAAEAQAEHERKERELEEAELARIAQLAVETAMKEAEEEEAKLQQEELDAANRAVDEQPAETQPALENQEETAALEDAPKTPTNYPQALDAFAQEEADAPVTPVNRPQELDTAVEPAPLVDLESTQAPPDVATEEAAAGTGDAAQPAPPSPVIAESVITEASEVPAKVGDRLERLLLLKAQILETQDIISNLKQQLADPEQDVASLSAQLQRTEKVLKKMERKEQRRYESGIAEQFYLTEGDHENTLVFAHTLNPKEMGLKVEERLEELMIPGAKSLELSIQLCPAKKPNGPKQKNKLVKVFEDYDLFSYATEDAKNGRISHIHIPEDQFRGWLIAHRTRVTSAQDDDPW